MTASDGRVTPLRDASAEDFFDLAEVDGILLLTAFLAVEAFAWLVGFFDMALGPRWLKKSDPGASPPSSRRSIRSRGSI
jgi:hypothetical protein